MSVNLSVSGNALNAVRAWKENPEQNRPLRPIIHPARLHDLPLHLTWWNAINYWKEPESCNILYPVSNNLDSAKQLQLAFFKDDPDSVKKIEEGYLCFLSLVRDESYRDSFGSRASDCTKCDPYSGDFSPEGSCWSDWRPPQPSDSKPRNCFPLWITLFPDVFLFLRKNEISPQTGRFSEVISQELGLNPSWRERSDYKYFQEFWLKPDQVIRPSEQNPFLGTPPRELDPEFRGELKKWVNFQRTAMNRPVQPRMNSTIASYGTDTWRAAPFSGCGRTIYWAKNNIEQSGPQEFLLRPEQIPYKQDQDTTYGKIYALEDLFIKVSEFLDRLPNIQEVINEWYPPPQSGTRRLPPLQNPPQALQPTAFPFSQLHGPGGWSAPRPPTKLPPLTESWDGRP